VRFYTAHLRPGAEPALVREGYSLGATILGPLWLIFHRCWEAGAVSLALCLGAGLAPAPNGTIALLTLAWLHGLFGHDLQRLTLALRGYRLSDVLAGRDLDAALARLLAARPELLERAA
jgi:hypothetical protein